MFFITRWNLKIGISILSAFASNSQLPFLILWMGENGCRNYFMINLQESCVAGLGLKLMTSLYNATQYYTAMFWLLNCHFPIVSWWNSLYNMFHLLHSMFLWASLASAVSSVSDCFVSTKKRIIYRLSFVYRLWHVTCFVLFTCSVNRTRSQLVTCQQQ